MWLNIERERLRFSAGVMSGIQASLGEVPREFFDAINTSDSVAADQYSQHQALLESSRNKRGQM